MTEFLKSVFFFFLFVSGPWKDVTVTFNDLKTGINFSSVLCLSSLLPWLTSQTIRQSCSPYRSGRVWAAVIPADPTCWPGEQLELSDRGSESP